MSGYTIPLEPVRKSDSIILKTLYTTWDYSKKIINAEINAKPIGTNHDLIIKNPFGKNTSFALAKIITLGVIATIFIIFAGKYKSIRKKYIKP